MNLDVAELLTIDVDAEVRKLAEAELGGSWQIPAELVRRSLRAQAHRVEVTLGRRGLRVADDGPPIDPDTVRWLAALLEGDQGAPVRHRALVELEARGEVGLLALVGRKPRGVRIVCEGVEVLRAGSLGAADRPRHGTLIEVEGAELDLAEARRWLKVALRFAPARVLLDGHELERGVVDAIIEVPLHSPLEGRVALSRSAEAARVWLLRWGVVATHTALPSGLVVEAALELGDRARRQFGAGELREAFKAELCELEEQAVDAAIATAAALHQLPAADRPKVRMLLLSSAQLARSPAVRRVKMLPALYGPTHALEWTSIDQLVHHAAARSALAVDSEARAASAVTQAPIFVLDLSERARLAQLFGVSFAPPPAPVSGSPAFSLRGVLETSGRLLRAAAGRVAGTWRKAVPLEALSEAERTALRVFESAAVAGGRRSSFSQVELCPGDGPVVLRKQTLLLPRKNREVVAAVAVVAKDAAWAYPALVALMGGLAMPPSAARDSWVAR
jgi:hypothetical protein